MDALSRSIVLLRVSDCIQRHVRKHANDSEQRLWRLHKELGIAAECLIRPPQQSEAA
jgi:hypothetical protein